MATHFLLTAAARTMSLRDVYKAGEDAAFDTFCKLRWPETEGKPVCPKCGHGEAFAIKTRRKFKCKSAACYHQFSPTSGTIFASRKMAYVDLLAAILIIVNGAKGVSALQLARDIGCQSSSGEHRLVGARPLIESSVLVMDDCEQGSGHNVGC